MAWANTVSAAPKSRLGRALTYLRNNWQSLNAYLEDGRIELSNNRAERSIKPFVMGRKNWVRHEVASVNCLAEKTKPAIPLAVA